MSATDFGRTDRDATDLEGTELWIQMPGSPLARRLFVGRVEGVDGPVLALIGDAGPRVLAVLLDEEAELELADLLGSLPDAALVVRDAGG